MQEFKGLDRFEIKGRGLVIVVENDKDRKKSDLGLLNEIVLIDNCKYEILGTEMFPTAYPILHSGVKMGLLVKEYKK